MGIFVAQKRIMHNFVALFPEFMDVFDKNNIDKSYRLCYNKRKGVFDYAKRKVL